MGFKKMETNLTFTDLSLSSSIEKNRAMQRMEQINSIVNWSRIEKLLITHYPVGKSSVGTDACLVYMVCLVDLVYLVLGLFRLFRGHDPDLIKLNQVMSPIRLNQIMSPCPLTAFWR